MAYNVKEQKDGKKEGSVRVNRKELIEDVVERIVERVVPYAAMMLVGVVLGYAWRMIQG